jgi:polyphosphate:AMP phosphotransferase
MFETAEIGNKIDKETYAKEAPLIRESLLKCQRELLTAKVPVVILVGGNEGSGKGELVNLLNEWMDARGIHTHAMWDPSDEEKERPRFWRFWRMLPPKGNIAIFFGSWYTEPIVERVYSRFHRKRFQQELERICEFEKMLSNEGVLLLKFWFHLSKKEQKKRFRELESDPLTAWKVSKLDWKFFKKYDRFRAISEEAVVATNTESAPWHIIEAVDRRYRTLTVAKTILEGMNEQIKNQRRSDERKPPTPELSLPKKQNLISKLDLTKSLAQKEYETALLKYQGELNLLTRRLHQDRKSVVLVFEGNDAAGKGGAVRRMIQGMDARTYWIVPVAAPTEEERAQPYLWRFWRQLPRLGKVTIFDRSWYGRVLVERVEGFCHPEDWNRAYEEINEFEDQLSDFGTIVIKFWLSISKQEQLRRFKERESIAYKQYKITDEDWRNRKKWGAYENAVCDMVERTSTPAAPWVLVEANDKKYARIKILKTICERLEKEKRQ